MRKKFIALYQEMETRTNDILSENPGIPGYVKVLDNIREKILQLKPLSGNMLNTREEEIEFFRDEWPAFYGRLFYFLKLHNFEMERTTRSPRDLEKLISQEEQWIDHFFKGNYEFARYYLSGSPAIDDDFTRVHSLQRTFEELSLVIDPDQTTVASYRAAWCLAYSNYRLFLLGESRALQNPEIVSKKRLRWKAGKTAAVEWIQALAESHSIEIDGKPATATALKEDFEDHFQEDLKDFSLLLYQADGRKRQSTPFLTKLINVMKERRRRLKR
ncbi:MAG: RteC domain-containing protein [Puia sp.]|nr:RteC domain-containing protein [Puia sp.]